MPFMRKAGLFFIPKCPTCDRGKSGVGRINSSGSSCGGCAGSSNGGGGSKSKVGNIVCFARDHLAWAGYEIRHGGLTIGEAKFKALSQFPRPTNISELTSFMGLVEQLAGFSSEVAAAKLRPLLSTRNPYVWTLDHKQAFDAVNLALISRPVVVHFDP